MAVLTVAMSMPAPPAAAEGEAQAAYEDVPVELIVNGEPRGDVFAKLGAGGDLLVDVEAFTQAGARVIGGARIELGGREYVLLQSIPGARHEFNEKTLQLAVNLPPDSFDVQRRQLRSRSSEPVVRTDDDSLFLNYQLGGGESSIAGSPLTLASELGVRRRGWLFLNGSQLQDDADGSRFQRFQTQLIRDDRDQATRLLAGDAFTPPSSLGSTMNLGGVSYARSYRLTPYFVQSPTASFSGAVASPSDVEVYVGGTRVYRDRLAPGSYELNDLYYYGGRRDVRVVLRDALGQEQVLEQSYYFSDQTLRRGLHEFSYHGGALRENYAQDDDRYGAFALSGVHRYGLTDAFMVGGRGEYSGSRFNLGPEVTWRSNELGLASLGLAYGQDGDASADGGVAVLAGYQFQYRGANLRLSLRHLPEGYGLADPEANARHVLDERLASLGYGSPRLGSASIQWLARTSIGEPERRVVQLNYSRALWRRVSVYASAERESQDATTSASLGFIAWFGQYSNAGFFHTRAPGSDTDTAQVSNSLGDRQGLEYRVSADSIRGEAGDATRFAPYLEYHTAPATAVADVQTQHSDTTGSSTDWRLAVQGTVYAIGGRWGLGRRVDDGYALARLSPPIEGVRVYHHGEEIGRTDRAGEVFVPGVDAFLDNRLAFAEQDVPIDYTLRETARVISPPFRAGALVEFKLGLNRNVVGRIVAAGAAAGEPLAYREFTLHLPRGDVVSETGSGGEFYLEDLEPGDYPGTLVLEDHACRFTLRVPQLMAPVVEIEPPVECER